MSSVKILKIDAKHLNLEVIQKGAQVIKDGGLVVYPTETCYGLGVNALDHTSVKKVFSVKKRLSALPIPIIVDTVHRAEKYAFFNKQAKKIAEKFWPGPLTIAVRKKSMIPNILNPDRIAMRIPDHPVPLSLTKSASVPITATSANRSGELSPYSVEAVQKSLGPIMDLILDSGTLPSSPPSTIVDFVMNPSPQITREGAISADSVLGALGIHRKNWWKHTIHLPIRSKSSKTFHPSF